MTAYHVYIGTYTTRGSEGVYLGRFDQDTGQVELLNLAARLENPTFLAVHPAGQALYVVHDAPGTAVPEVDGAPEGAVSAFAIDAESGALSFLGQQPSKGVTPCHVSIDATGRYLMVANFRGANGGTVAMLPIQDDGSLAPPSCTIQHQGSGPHPARQAGPHAHSITPAPSNRFAYAADLGIDKVLIYRMDLEQGRLLPHDPPSVSVAPGAGPRHFAFHPSGEFAYLINEISNTMTAFAYDAAGGSLSEIETVSTLPDGFDDVSHCADVHISASGEFVYGSNRGHDSIVIFRVDQESGKLSLVEHVPTQGGWPRNFCLSPSGAYLIAANQEGDNLVTFAIDPESGRLTPTGCNIKVPAPVCLALLEITRV